MYPGRLDEILEEEHRKCTGIQHELRGDPTFLPVFLTGGVGDGILCRGTLQQLKDSGLDPLIYSHHAEALRYFYPDTLIIKGDLPNFTWCLHLDSVAKFKFSDQFAGFQIKAHEELFKRHLERLKERPDIGHLLRIHPRSKAVFAQKAVELGLNAKTLPLWLLGFNEIKFVEVRHKKEPENYITIHDGFDLNNINAVSSRCTKQWKWEHWNTLVYLLRHKYPTTAVIQLGSKTSRIIDGTSENLVMKTTLPQAFEVISKAKLHIDTDSGLVHAATAMGVPVIALFGPSPRDFYGHKENSNLYSTKSCSGGCFHLGKNWQTGWMDKCPIGYETPRCMDDIEPEVVLAEVIRRLDD